MVSVSKSSNFDHLVTLFNTMMSFLSKIMVYIAICRHELLPFVDEKSSYKNDNFYGDGL